MLNTNHFELRSSSGGVYWGPIKKGLPKTSFEKSLVDNACNQFFNFLDPVFRAHRIKWLLNTVLNSICAVKKYDHNGKLLEDCDYLRLVFSEAYALGDEIWGPWIDDENKLFNDMISLIIATKTNENSMFKDVKLRLRTETMYLAGLAPNRDKYKELVQLNNKILEISPSNNRVR